MRANGGHQKAFDVAVVGGGAAGCVMAARLSESPSRSVLLLEAGPDRRGAIPEPFRDGWGFCRELDWGLVSEPSESREPTPLLRTRMLGGTSWVTRFAVRGSPADFDQWSARGIEGWRFDDALPWFCRLERDLEFGDQPWHGATGPIPITRYPDAELTEAAQAGLAAIERCGFPVVDDLNRPGAVGAGRMPMNALDGRRVTTADAYLPRSQTRPNLVIRADSEVSSVEVEKGAASAVRLCDGTRIEAGHVILCAGTYGSPAILLRSGIGPADALRALDIHPRHDLPGVGANLADHPSIWLDVPYAGAVREAPSLNVVVSFHSAARSHDEPPDLLLWMPEPSGDPPEFGIEAILMQPEARGRVTLRSPDPSQRPRIELPELVTAADRDRIREACERAQEVLRQPELRRACDSSVSQPPDVDVDAMIRTELYSIPHVVGTCAMGARPADGAVVDETGALYGVENLSVVDASIIPQPPTGFPHVIAIMLAERLAEAIARKV